MKNLLRYLRNYKKESVLGPLFKLLEASFELLVPLVMANIIDVGIMNSDENYIIKMGLVLVLLGIVGLVCAITAQYYAAKAAVGFGTELRKDLFSHINSLSYSELDTIGSSTLITRITSDVNQLQTGVNMVLRLFLRSPFIVFGAMIMSFTVDAKSAVTFVVTIPALSIVIFGIMLITLPYYGKVQKQIDKVLKHVRENLSGVRVVRAFNRQQDEIEDFNNSSDELKGLQMFVGKISALLNPVTYVIVNLSIIAILWIGGNQTYNGIIPQGRVIAQVNYMSQILVELIKLANLIVLVTKSFASGKRVDEIFKCKSSMVEGVESAGGDSATPKVVFEDVTFRYKGAKEPSLENVSFSVNKGDTIGIIGGTGSGKTSLVNLIPRFYDVEKGRVLVDGLDVRKYGFEQLRNKIGIVPQKAVLFSGTIRENILWGRNDANDEDINRALGFAQATDVVASKEKGLDEHVLQGGKNLSGGQRQRLTIARALVKNPEILILDDSASALDFATDAKLRKAIKEMDNSITTFIVSQRTASVKHADSIVVLEDGEVAGIGTHDELLEKCDVYKEIYQSQASVKEDGINE